MKRLFILASAAALMLASCAKTTVVYNEAPEEISFKQVTNVMTKGNLESTVQLGVIAYKAGGASKYFDNTCFAHDGNYWSADKYWPVSGELDFILYAPHSATAVQGGSDYSKLLLTVDNSDMNQDQIDWLYADRRYDGTSKTTPTVAVNFNHALAQIVVNLKADTDNVVTIKSFNIDDTRQKGTLTVNQNNNNTIDWSDVQESEKFDWSLSQLTGQATLDKTTGREDNCFVIPSNQTSFTMTYTLDGVENDGEPKILEYVHEFDGGIKWDAGKKYIYNITIGVTEIKFSCTESGWTDIPNSTGETMEWIADVDNIAD